MQENMKETIVDTGSVVLEDGEFRDELLTSAGAATYKEGTILARASNTLKLVPFVKGGSTNENGIPKVVLTYEAVAPGAGDISVRVMIAGDVKKERLVIHADGDDANVDAAVVDQLRSYGITPVSVKQLAPLDNIPSQDS